MKYSVMENAGSIIISVVKKEIRGKFTIGIRTKGGTATPDEDFQAIDRELHFNENDLEREVEIFIIDDDSWEPDEDF